MTASLEVSLGGASHLSADSLARLRSLLVAESQAQAAQTAEVEATLSLLGGDADADSLLERDLAEARAARVRQAIDDIEHALDRLATGTYGVCETCGAAMPFERLEAIPAARYCVSCSRRGGALLL